MWVPPQQARLRPQCGAQPLRGVQLCARSPWRRNVEGRFTFWSGFTRGSQGSGSVFHRIQRLFGVWFSMAFLCCCITHSCDRCPHAAGSGDRGKVRGPAVSGRPVRLLVMGPSEHTGRKRTPPPSSPHPLLTFLVEWCLVTSFYHSDTGLLTCVVINITIRVIGNQF